MNTEIMTPAMKEKFTEIAGILDIKDQNKKSQEDYSKRIDDAKTSLPILQQEVDNVLLAGEKPDEYLRAVDIKKAEIQAFERHLQLLIDQADKITQKEKTAKVELSELISEVLTALREDTRNKFSALFKETNATLALYEKIDELNLCRNQFVNFYEWVMAISRVVSPHKT